MSFERTTTQRSIRLATIALFATLAVCGGPPRRSEATVECGEEVGTWTGGSVSAVATDGDYWYYSAGTTLRIADVSDPASLEVIGSVALSSNLRFISVLAVSGDHALVAGGLQPEPGYGLVVVDISDPSAPAVVGSLRIAPVPHGIAVAGDYVLLAEDHRLSVVDVSNPAAPVVVSSTYIAYAVSSVAVAGDHAFVTSDWRLYLFDISDPATPVAVGSVDMPYRPGRTVDMTSDYAFVADPAAGLRVFDLSTPTAPVQVGLLGLPASNVAVAGDYAYVTASSSLHVVDISTPAAPVEVGSLDTPGGSFKDAVAIAGSAAFGAANTFVHLLDVSTPSAPTIGWSFPTGSSFRSIAEVDGLVYVADELGDLYIFDTSEPTDPTGVGFYLPAASAIHDLSVVGHLAFLATPYQGLRVVDISSPTAPIEIGSLTNWHPAFGIAVDQDIACLAEGYAGLWVVDVSTPAAPATVGYVSTPGSALQVAILGHHAYVADKQGGLRVIDIGTPGAPMEVGALVTPGDAYDVAAVGSYAYVAADDSGLRVIDISSPTAPTEVGSWQTVGPALSLAVAGDSVHVSGNWLNVGVQVIDVRVPSSPVEIWRSPVGTAVDLDLSGDYAYVANSSGLHVVRQCPLLFHDSLESGDTSAWSAAGDDPAELFNTLLAGRGIGGDYVACTFDALTGDFTYLGQVFNQADGGLGGTPITDLVDLYWKNESLASTVPPYNVDDADGDTVANALDADAFDGGVQ